MDKNHQQQLLDSLLEQLPIGVILTDEKGEMVFINRTAERIRKIRREDLIGSSILNCHQAKSQPNVQRAVDNIMRKPDTVYRRMVEDANNGQFYINTYAGLVDEKNQPIGMAVLTEDVTEKRKLEIERAKTYQIMQETSESLRSKYHELLVASLETIAIILEKRDPYTRNHSRNVCEYALKMYEYRFGVGSEYNTLKSASTLHDIGKIGIPDQVLHKPGKLTPEEYETIKLHSLIAEEILKPLDAGSAISTVVRHHHEHFDGSGYPDKLHGERIPMLSRIIAIADAYDAMHSDRPYRPALPYERCVQEISQNAGKQFDPEWAGIFLELTNTGSI